jgi:hypothetical protein
MAVSAKTNSMLK